MAVRANRRTINNCIIIAVQKQGFYVSFVVSSLCAAKSLVKSLLVVDSTARYSALDVLKHPWTTGGASAVVLNVKDNLHKYNARRRFREGVRKVQAMQLFAKLGKMKLEDDGGPASLAAAASVSPAPGGAASLPVPSGKVAGTAQAGAGRSR
jgi:hypothetical protein